MIQPVKGISKIIKYLVISSLFVLPLALVPSLYAAEFSLTPSSGYVAVGDEFVVDILIDSEGEDVTTARSVITFDPKILQLVEADRNNTLFEKYPSDEQSTDNTNGVVMLTGFTQSGSGTLYTTEGSPDVYARLKFKAIAVGNVTFDWEYSGSDQQFQTVIMINGSPPQNGLSAKPSSASFVVEGQQTPVTALGINENKTTYILSGIAIIGAVLIFSGGNVLYNSSKNIVTTDKGTLVRYD